MAEGAFLALVMEQATGTLSQRKYAGDELCRIAWGLACSLALLNELGLVHGDIKPSNVLLHEGGWPLLADYGCATELASLTGTGVRRGRLGPDERVRVVAWTRKYAAPEVPRGKLLSGPKGAPGAGRGVLALSSSCEGRASLSAATRDV